LSLVGIVTALLLVGQGFSITALMGMLMVIGIAVSNGILLVSGAIARVSAGEDPVDTFRKASTVLAKLRRENRELRLERAITKSRSRLGTICSNRCVDHTWRDRVLAPRLPGCRDTTCEVS
jgi:hypothetical protein